MELPLSTGGVNGELYAPSREQEVLMLIGLAAIIAVAWLLGFTVFHVASSFIHILIVVAAIVLILHFVRGARTRSGAS